MKRAVIVAFIVGILLGLGQVYLSRQVHTGTWSPDICQVVGGCCPDDGHPAECPTYVRKRGFPFSVERTDSQKPLLYNFFILAGGLPALAFVAGKFLKKK